MINDKIMIIIMIIMINRKKRMDENSTMKTVRSSCFFGSQDKQTHRSVLLIVDCSCGLFMENKTLNVRMEGWRDGGMEGPRD